MSEKTHMDQVQDLIDLKAAEKRMMDSHEALEGFIEKSNGELAEVGKISTETKNAVDALAEKTTKLGDRVHELEQAQHDHFEGAAEVKSAGEALVDSDQYKKMAANVMSAPMGQASVEVKTAIVNAVPSLTQPMTAGHRLPYPVKEPDRALRIRDLFLQGVTDSNIVNLQATA